MYGPRKRSAYTRVGLYAGRLIRGSAFTRVGFYASIYGRWVGVNGFIGGHMTSYVSENDDGGEGVKKSGKVRTSLMEGP